MKHRVEIEIRDGALQGVCERKADGSMRWYRKTGPVKSSERIELECSPEAAKVLVDVLGTELGFRTDGI